MLTHTACLWYCPSRVADGGSIPVPISTVVPARITLTKGAMRVGFMSVLLALALSCVSLLTALVPPFRGSSRAETAAEGSLTNLVVDDEGICLNFAVGVGDLVALT